VTATGAARGRLLAAGRRAAWVVLAGLAFAVPVGARVAFEGRAELDRAELARAEGRVDDRIVHLGRAARWRLPVAAHEERALEELSAIGVELEAAGDVEGALTAWREIRGALLATRGVRIPHPERLRHANGEIARLMAEQERRLGTDLSGRGAQEEYHLALLQEVPGPAPWPGIGAALAFAAWIAATVGFVLRALDAHGRLRPRAALRWGGASLVLLAAWMVLLRAL
jgi:hypothetical protein